MKLLLKIWDVILLLFVFSKTKHDDRFELDNKNNDFLRGTSSQKKS